MSERPVEPGAKQAAEATAVPGDHGTGNDGIAIWALGGVPEVRPGDDLIALIARALEGEGSRNPDRMPRDGDVLVITSKILSKAEGRIVSASDREDAITSETVRVVASRARQNGEGFTRIVENRLGIVGAAAGVDASNTDEGTVLLLPEDPDASAEHLRAGLSQHFGVAIGIVISDTLGRAWRVGQTDIAIGAAGLRVLHDHRGGVDAGGRALDATQVAVADELAGAADLVKGKASGRPVAVVRGVGHLLTGAGAPAGIGAHTEAHAGARSLVRTGPGDMFRMGTDEALAEGYRRALVGEPLEQ